MDVWRALLGHQVSVLGHEDVEVGPAAVAALVHIITRHKHLWGQHRWLLSVLELDSGLHYLGHRDGVAGAALALVSEVTREIVAVEVTVVKFLGDVAVWDVCGVGVELLPLSRLVEDALKLFVALGAELLLVGILFLLFQTLGVIVVPLARLQEESLFFAVFAIVRVRLLILADVGLPAQVRSVDRRNEQVHLVRRLVLQVHVHSLLGLHLIYFQL